MWDILFGVWGLSVGVGLNIFMKRPLYAQIYRTFGFGALGYGSGRLINLITERRKHIRLHAIEHYKSQFPERVPKETPMYYADLLREWKPNR